MKEKFQSDRGCGGLGAHGNSMLVPTLMGNPDPLRGLSLARMLFFWETQGFLDGRGHHINMSLESCVIHGDLPFEHSLFQVQRLIKPGQHLEVSY